MKSNTPRWYQEAIRPRNPGIGKTFIVNASLKKHNIFKTYTFAETFPSALSDTFRSVIC